MHPSYAWDWRRNLAHPIRQQPTSPAVLKMHEVHIYWTTRGCGMRVMYRHSFGLEVRNVQRGIGQAGWPRILQKCFQHPAVARDARIR